jgi:4,5-DOPA dioxygenase extradiol
MTRLPSLFVSHGSPTLALDPGSSGPGLARVAASLPRPAAVLVASAHWGAPQPTLGAAERPETIHDFWGFPRPLYELRYPAPGAAEVAKRAHELLRGAGLGATLDGKRGLDHGAWVPLRFMYPDADVPVVQVAIQYDADAAHHLRIGRALAPLADEGVLIVGSGSATHNLREVRWGERENEAVPSWVQEFRTWLADALARGDVDSLLDYRRRAPHAVRNHPTEDHILPLFVPLGAAGIGSRVERHNDLVTFGVLGMDAFLMRPAVESSVHTR